mmetsp:Transcript_1177/g.4338  ORF Transcript_1177/g.4338 Transcript_1177/m.4338 type:complete len:219 (+) Transcript_1177:345-1001(+)
MNTFHAAWCSSHKISFCLCEDVDVDASFTPCPTSASSRRFVDDDVPNVSDFFVASPSSSMASSSKIARIASSSRSLSHRSHESSSTPRLWYPPSLASYAALLCVVFPTRALKLTFILSNASLNASPTSLARAKASLFDRSSRSLMSNTPEQLAELGRGGKNTSIARRPALFVINPSTVPPIKPPIKGIARDAAMVAERDAPRSAKAVAASRVSRHEEP